MTSLQNLFVAKLPRNLTDADLQQIFASFGPESAKIMLDAATGKSKGFGFVLFDSVEKGTEAYKALNKTHVTLHGHSFNLAIFPSKHDGKVATEVSNCLYIRNIPKQLSQMEVENFLKTFGNLTYCAMREDHYGSPVWVVYAEYEDIEEAKNALSKLHGSRNYFEYSPVAILAKYADSMEAKQERRKRREGNNSNSSNSAHHHHPPTTAQGGAPASPPRPLSHRKGSPAPYVEVPTGGASPPILMGGSSVPPPAMPMAAHAHPHPHPHHHHMHLPHGAAVGSVFAGHFRNGGTGTGGADAYPSTGVMPPPPLLGVDAGPGGVGAHAAGGPRAAAQRFTGMQPQRFAPSAPRASAPTSATNNSHNGSLDSSMVGAFGASAGTTTMLSPQQTYQRSHAHNQAVCVEGSAMAGMSDSSPIGNSLAAPGVGATPAVGTNPTPPSCSSFLNVTFPTTHPHCEQSSNDRATPLTPLNFCFDHDLDGHTPLVDQAVAGGPAAAYVPTGGYQEMPLQRVMSSVSSKSLQGANGNSGRYRHNPYAPVTPMSSAPSSAGPSTPRVGNLGLGGCPGPLYSPMAGAAAGYPSHQQAPQAQQQQQQQQQPVSVTMHYRHSRTSSNSGVHHTSHFTSTGVNGYLAAPNVRDPQGSQQPSM